MPLTKIVASNLVVITLYIQLLSTIWLHSIVYIGAHSVTLSILFHRSLNCHHDMKL